MADPVIQSTPFKLIAAAIRTRVAAALSVDEQFIRLTASDDYKVTEVENVFCYVRIYGPAPPQDPGLRLADSGGGRRARFVERRVRFYLYSRQGVDVYGGDEVALAGSEESPDADVQPPGQYDIEELLYDAIDDWVPLNEAGTRSLTIGPLHVLDDNGPPERRPENEEGLLRSYIDAGVVYQLSIDPTEPAPT